MQAFAAGHVGVAVPAAAPAVQQAAIPRALDRLPDVGRLLFHLIFMNLL